MASRGYDIPKPEAGIADWASKIRDMQRQVSSCLTSSCPLNVPFRQVDADEETEQRRLEEEIAASRLKRLSRRSQLGGSRSNSLDLCTRDFIVSQKSALHVFSSETQGICCRSGEGRQHIQR